MHLTLLPPTLTSKVADLLAMATIQLPLVLCGQYLVSYHLSYYLLLLRQINFHSMYSTYPSMACFSVNVQWTGSQVGISIFMVLLQSENDTHSLIEGGPKYQTVSN